MLNKCLVSGSALRWEGQLTVYNLTGGPTYRCMYPTPPPAEAVTNCSDGGVIGAVPGLIGVLQVKISWEAFLYISNKTIYQKKYFFLLGNATFQNKVFYQLHRKFFEKNIWKLKSSKSQEITHSCKVFCF